MNCTLSSEAHQQIIRMAKSSQFYNYWLLFFGSAVWYSIWQWVAFLSTPTDREISWSHRPCGWLGRVDFVKYCYETIIPMFFKRTKKKSLTTGRNSVATFCNTYVFPSHKCLWFILSKNHECKCIDCGCFVQSFYPVIPVILRPLQNLYGFGLGDDLVTRLHSI